MVIWGRGLIFRLTQANAHEEPNIGSRIKLNKTIITQVNFIIEKIRYKRTFKSVESTGYHLNVVEYGGMEFLHSLIQI